MYQASNNDQERIHCLKQILRINPKGEKAKQMLDTLTGQDFPFESSQKVPLPIQAQKNNAPLVAQAEKPVNKQNNQSNEKTASKSTSTSGTSQKNIIIGCLAVLAGDVKHRDVYERQKRELILIKGSVRSSLLKKSGLYQ